MTGAHHFAEKFLGPIKEGDQAEELEYDDLGYYDDGVKRTLTDEQIAIFRHSEIEAMLRQRRHADDADEAESQFIHGTDYVRDEKVVQPNSGVGFEPKSVEDDVALEDYELKNGTNSQPPQNQKTKKNNRKKKKNGKNGQRISPPKSSLRQHVKPDLRKRTWDKVDTGLANLEYDDDAGRTSVPSPAAQRRCISYDDC